MRVLYHSRLVGTFLGFAPSTIHRLDGTAWRQIAARVEHVNGERPDSCGSQGDRLPEALYLHNHPAQTVSSVSDSCDSRTSSFLLMTARHLHRTTLDRLRD